MKILLHGDSGKVGRQIGALCGPGTDWDIVARANRAVPLADPAGAEVLIDFSRPDALTLALEFAVQHELPVVTGTTGLDADAQGRLVEASGRIPICQAANFAVGVHVLEQLVREAAGRLGPEFAIELVETHHRHKIDAPSGTALTLAAAAADGRGLDASTSIRTDGHAGAPRAGDRIGIQSLRGGDVVGEHEVHFLGDGERLVLRHAATDRSLFARGALRAARWLRGRSPGLYSIGDVLAPA
jgi:4-hydroxy-tetrahydrodipicolinate reductase